MSDVDNIEKSLELVQSILEPLKEGEYAIYLNKVSSYISAIGKSVSTNKLALESIRLQAKGNQDQYKAAVKAKTSSLKASFESYIKFARLNIDLAMANALDNLVRRPKSASKIDENKRIESLQKWFDQLPNPADAMLEHFIASSTPLDKWLVAGQWGHQYLKKRRVDLETYDRRLCEIIKCSDSTTVRIVQSYGKLNRAIDALEKCFLKTLEEIAVA